jgi:hypothetical protein
VIQEVLRSVIDLANGDHGRRWPPIMQTAAWRDGASCIQGGATTSSARSSWTARSSDPWTRAAVMFYTFGAAIASGVGDDPGVSFTKYTKGLLLVHGDPADQDRYRATAPSLGFEGHLEWAAAMP